MTDRSVTGQDEVGTSWFFAYGVSTDPDRMTAEAGGFQQLKKASLKDHVYAFSGEQASIGGGASSVRPLAGGVVLGVAYQVNEEQLSKLAGLALTRELTTCTISIGGADVQAVTLRYAEEQPLNAPVDEYVELVRTGLYKHYPHENVDLYLERAVERTKGENLITRSSATPDSFKFEYGSQFRRLFPWQNSKQSPFGGAWAVVAPGDQSLPHCHDEEETFVCLSGEGLMSIDGHEFTVKQGDAVYLKPYSAHCVTNSGTGDLSVMWIWWGGLPPELMEDEPLVPAQAAAQ